MRANSPAVAGDFADGDGDGLGNRLEYAFGGDPNSASTSSLPKSSVLGHKLAITFMRTVANTDLTMTVQAGDNPAGPWIDLASSAFGAPITALIGGVTVAETNTGATRNVEVRDIHLTTDPVHPHRFLRLKISR